MFILYVYKILYVCIIFYLLSYSAISKKIYYAIIYDIFLVGISDDTK